MSNPVDNYNAQLAAMEKRLRPAIELLAITAVGIERDASQKLPEAKVREAAEAFAGKSTYGDSTTHDLANLLIAFAKSLGVIE